MWCENSSHKYLVWQRRFDQWEAGDLAPLCATHAAQAAARIQRGELLACEVWATSPQFTAAVPCAWNVQWPLVDELQTIELF